MIGLRGHDESTDPYAADRIERLRRKVAWQVSTAYGLPLEENVTVSVTVPPEAPVAIPVIVPTREPDVDEVRMPTLVELERMVNAAAEMDPERAEEWRWYLFYLRDFATIDGRLDNGFRLLVETAFSPLV